MMRHLPDLVYFTAILLLGVALPAYLAHLGQADWAWMAYGAGAWLVAVVVKIVGSSFMHFMLNRPEVSAWTRAALSGLWSAACELGAVMVVLWYAHPYPGLKEGVSLGLGAGCLEVLMVGAYAGYKTLQPPASPPKGSPWRPVVMSLTERILAVIGHVASRGLVWIGLMSWARAAWLIPAVLFFAVVDGVAAYGTDRGWDWEAPAVQLRFYGFLVVLGVVEALVFWAALRSVTPAGLP